MTRPIINRRHLLSATATFSLGSALPVMAANTSPAVRATPLPLSAVRLLPSPYKTAVDVNERYLLSLDPDRFLHNYRKFAGLTPKAEGYGGWENDTIAGHSLGHYLSAISLMYAQTGNAELKNKADYIIRELAVIQGAHGDGYVAGFTRKRKDGSIVDGKEIFPEIMAGDIQSAGFDLNGCWVPFYNWHKLFTGLFDAQTHCGLDRGIAVAAGLGGYIERVFAALDDSQTQKVLDCEYGGLNETFAELYARTDDKRWLKLSETFHHRRVLDPLKSREDNLANMHANTYIPKVLGMARQYEVTGDESYRVASDAFWSHVVTNHSYVIGGNGDREYFFQPNTISKHITEATCEHCSTYNMLRLTRYMYSWQPKAEYFDFYERGHLNHVMAAQRPDTGMFSYMTPLFTGAKRGWSHPENTWTCCHGTGIESHAKHGDSIWWEAGDTLFVNLYIPSTARWASAGADVRMDTRYPYDGAVSLSFTQLRRPRRAKLALRVPGWAKTAQVSVNGKSVQTSSENGYLIIDRVWSAGDRVAFDLPLDLRVEPTGDDPGVVALLSGPVVLAADLGSDEEPWSATDPALVGSDLVAGIRPVDRAKGHYETVGIGRPGNLKLVPFYSQYTRRSAVYFKRFTAEEWAVEEANFAAEQARQRDLAARSVDVMHLGEMQAERDHNLEAAVSWPGTYRGRNGRDARNGGFMEFVMSTSRDGKPVDVPLVMQMTYWGSDRRGFDILIDGQKMTAVEHDRPHPGEFFDEEYPVPLSMTKGKTSIVVRLVPHDRRSTAMIFGVRLFTAAADATA